MLPILSLLILINFVFSKDKSVIKLRIYQRTKLQATYDAKVINEALGGNLIYGRICFAEEIKSLKSKCTINSNTQEAYLPWVKIILFIL
jgi:hypothetical protein